MNYNLEFNSPVIGRIQPFEYSYATTNEYAFTYGRDILSDLSKFNAPIFVARKRRGIFTYDKIMQAKRDRYGFEIKNTILSSKQIRRGIFFDMFKDLLIYQEKDNASIFKNIYINDSINNTNIFKNINIKKEKLGFEISNKNLFCKNENMTSIFKNNIFCDDENITNIFKDYLLDYAPKKVEIIGLVSAKNKTFTLEVFNDYFLSKPINVANINKSIFGETPTNILNINKNVFTKFIDRILNVQEMLIAKKSINTLHAYNQYILSEPNNVLNVFNNYMASNNKNGIDVNLYKTFFVKSPIKHLSINNSFAAKEKNINKIFINKVLNAKRKDLILNINKQISAKNKYILTIDLYNKMYLLNNSFIKTTNVNEYYEIYKKYKDTTLQYDIPSLLRYKNNINVFKDDISLKFNSKIDIALNKYNIFLYERPSYNKIYLNKDIILSKIKRDFDINDIEYILFRIKNGFSINETEKNLIREKYELEVKDTTKSMFKDKNEFAILNNLTSILRERYGFSINNTETFLKEKKQGFVIDDFAESIYRNIYSMSINVTEVDLSKLKLPLGVVTHDNTIGFIISEKKLSIEKHNQSLYKIFKDVFTQDTTEFLEKDKHRTGILLTDLFMITEKKKTFLEYYHGIMLEKNAKDCFVNMLNEFVEKNTKNAIIDNNSIMLSKNYKDIFIRNNIHLSKNFKNVNINNKNIFLDKNKKEIWTLNNVCLDKSRKEFFIKSNIWINKQSHESNVFTQESIIKAPYEVYVENENVFIDKAKHYTNINDFLNIHKKEKYICNNKDIEISKEKRDAHIDNYTFITKEQYETNKYISQMTYMQKLMKDLEKPVEKTYNWVYVYQYEDPIDPNYDYYGLDELLLPEKDIDYSSFENAIFDKKNMRPKNPIKIIDDNTFIAKYPIKHPIPDYEDIGIVYIDVPSELMYTIFTKFYQIWYANIFKFGNMSMIESLKLMMEYMYSYIITNFSGTSYLEQALRVFRQIRWFGETSVMHNAQYKISYEYEDLKSNLQTGECMIENELQGFFVDNKLKVLSTELTSLNQEAYIKLYIPNKEETTISFSISLIGGNVEVYINNNLVDVIYSNHSIIIYDLPETDDKNEFMLKRSISNKIGQCYVGNIVVKNGTFKNLNIEYDPELKAGNMPLNDIVNKMVILANMYEDEQKAFEQFREGNLAVSELYKRLENYWELHHANKIKGKRLTIKET